jgi:hypothetical protein
MMLPLLLAALLAAGQAEPAPGASAMDVPDPERLIEPEDYPSSP